MTINKQIIALKEAIVSGERSLIFDEAMFLSRLSSFNDLLQLFACANAIRQLFRGNVVDLCAITNAKSGNCSQDCSFCAQSSRHNTHVNTHSLLSQEEMVARAKKAYAQGTKRFCIVTSGCSVEAEEFETICRAIKEIKEKFPLLKMDASLGKLSREQAQQLKEAGLDRYNHNIETDESFFKNICTTHSFSDRLRTLEFVKEAGIERCCGGIIGLGESDEERVRMAFRIKELDVDCVPVNFLNPIKGTPLENNHIPEPVTLLKLISVYRFILPDKQIRICGGRQANLRSMQSMIFYAGADAIIMGDYLTTKGSEPHVDLQMIEDAGLQVG